MLIRCSNEPIRPPGVHVAHVREHLAVYGVEVRFRRDAHYAPVDVRVLASHDSMSDNAHC